MSQVVNSPHAAGLSGKKTVASGSPFTIGVAVELDGEAPGVAGDVGNDEAPGVGSLKASCNDGDLGGGHSGYPSSLPYDVGGVQWEFLI